MEHFYTKITGWFTFPNFYKEMVTKFQSGSLFCEVGTYSGQSFAYLAVEMINQGKSFNLTACDSYTFNDEKTGENIMDQFIKNMELLPIEVNIIKGQSWESAELFEDESIYFCFLDADHVYSAVKRDILAWLPKMKKGGIIAGHDYCDPRWWENEHPGVEKAVKEIFGDDWGSDYLEEKVWFKQL